MVTVSPWVGTVPAKVTSPDAGARTPAASSSATSTPRCCPPAYGLSPSEKARRTGPSAGQLQAAASGAPATVQTSADAATSSFVVGEANIVRP